MKFAVIARDLMVRQYCLKLVRCKYLVFLLTTLPLLLIIIRVAYSLHGKHYIHISRITTPEPCAYSQLTSSCLKGNKSTPSICIPHRYLIDQLGYPDPCQHSFLILQCTDPCRSFLEDPSVYRTCGIDPTTISFLKRTESDDMESKKDDYRYNTHSELCTDHDILISKKVIKIAKNETRDAGNKVPRVIHYVSIGCGRTFIFVNYLSVLSADRFIHPEKIIFHGDCLPIGKWWNRTLDEIPNIYFRHWARPKLIQGRKPMWVQHETDIIRLEVLLVEGGIYMDTDALVLKPVDDLLKYPITLGHEYIEMDYYLGSGFILTQPNSSFICMWLHSFREYNPKGINDWAKYAVIAPGKIAQMLPDYIHLEERSFFRPNWAETNLLYDDFYDWSKNYILHLWNRNAKDRIVQDPSDLPPEGKARSTMEEVVRFIYFGDKRIKAQTLVNERS